MGKKLDVTNGRKMCDADRDKIATLLKKGLSANEISDILGWSPSGINYVSMAVDAGEQGKVAEFFKSGYYRNDSLLDWVCNRYNLKNVPRVSEEKLPNQIASVVPAAQSNEKLLIETIANLQETLKRTNELLEKLV